MKSILKITGMIYIFLFSFSGIYHDEEKIEFKIIDGIQIVSNPKYPVSLKGFPTKMILKEELSMGGANKKKEYMLTEVRSLAVDNEERIYVLDRKKANIKVFDKSGEYLRTIGKKGLRQGMLNDPMNIFVSNKNEIAVSDFMNRCLLFYSKEGKLIKSLSAANMYIINSAINSEGNIIAMTIPIDQGRFRYELKIFDSDLNLLKTIATLNSPTIQDFDPFWPGYFWEIAKNDNIFYSFPRKYEIQIFNPRGKLIKKIVKDYDPVEITKEEKEEAMKKAPPGTKFNFPQCHSAFKSFTVDDEGRLFVQTWDRTKNSEGYYYDVFNSEGKYFAKIHLKARPIFWKKHKLYTVEKDEYNLPVVKRYKVLWE